MLLRLPTQLMLMQIPGDMIIMARLNYQYSMEALPNLREVSVGYTFDKIGFLNKVGIRDVNLSLIGRNLWIIS